ncbi:hypothetical protein BFP72_03740 [Reichenbachiella sp. 5M10]|uniref:hypothetical protein n=1 Tax=Reichenbachiella sp. 5M10 TaxID=1889772 RepID=UPI000C151417|nr:hypothetical protein [Reichenbachiella sp. 5M10]PIB34583.1 hypothetical protein BFP72_03740 [Reichenbachiella sp. 5M10]
MKNPSILISDKWEVKRDVFYEIDPLDKSIDDERKFNDLYFQEDLFWISSGEFNLDLGWYGEGKKGHFILYLYRGNNWHNCQLLEKRITCNYQSIIELVNKFIKNVESGLYERIKTDICSIDDYTETIEIISLK